MNLMPAPPKFRRCARYIRGLLRSCLWQLGARAQKEQLTQLSGHLAATRPQKPVRARCTKTPYAPVRHRRSAQRGANEIHAMLDGTFRQLNAEFGFSADHACAAAHAFVQDMQRIEHSHVQCNERGQRVLNQPGIYPAPWCALDAFARRAGVGHQRAGNVEQSATSQLDAQLRERKRSFTRRIEAVDRIQQAATGWKSAWLRSKPLKAELLQLQQRLGAMDHQLLAAPVPTTTVADDQTASAA